MFAPFEIEITGNYGRCPRCPSATTIAIAYMDTNDSQVTVIWECRKCFNSDSVRMALATFNQKFANRMVQK